jgi:dTDP-6-deoxy-L-talose 4-dehydrogenase (NAD+)
MKVLVTGATGFIGNYVVEELLRHNCSVIASSSNQQKAEQAPWFNKVTYISFDFASFDPAVNYFRFFNEPDLMIHLAWEGLPNYKSSFHEEINLPRHLALVSNLIKNGLNDLTVTGTCFEYGMLEGCLSEDMSTFPTNPYGKAKDTLRKELELLRTSHPFVFKWARLFYMYGKGQNPNSLLSQLDKSLAIGEPVFNMSGGEQIRDFLPVEKVAVNIVRIALQQKVTGVINCCSGEPVTVKAFVENYLDKQNQKITLNLGFYPYPDYEPMRFWGDITKLKNIPGNE